MGKAARNVQSNPRQAGKANPGMMFSRRHQRVNGRGQPPRRRPIAPPPSGPCPPSSPWLPVVVGGLIGILIIAMALMISSGPLVVPLEPPTPVYQAVAMVPTETATAMPPTHTPLPTPTATAIPPTLAPIIPPTATPVPPTATEVPPTPTPTPTEPPPTPTPTPTCTATRTPVPTTAIQTPTATAYTIEVYFFFHYWCHASQEQARDFERLAQSYRSTGLHQRNRTFVLAAIAFVLVPPVQEEVRVGFWLVPLSGTPSQNAAFQAEYAPSVSLGQNPSLIAQYDMSDSPVVIASNKSTGVNSVLSTGRTSYSSMKTNLDKFTRGESSSTVTGWI